MALKDKFHLFLLMVAFLLIGTGCGVLPSPIPPSPQKAPPSPTVKPAPSFTPEEESSPLFEDTPVATEAATCIDLDTELRAQMEEIEDQVVTLRGLYPTGSVDQTLLTPDELRQRVIEDFLSDYTVEDAQDEARLMTLLGLLPPEFDLWNFYADLYSEQIAGFYDDSVPEMAIICGSGFKGPERITYAHEYAHALQDQTYDLENGLGYDDETCEANFDRCAALQALVEGDATLLEEQWLQIYASGQDFADLIEFLNDFDTPVFDSAPRFIRQDMLFPYMAGLSFIKALYIDGGWAAVDAAFASPPSTTEQILHPEKYPQEIAIELEVPNLVAALGGAWREIGRNVLGEWTTQTTLNEFIPKADAVKAADGWGGDYYLAFYNDQTGQGVLLVVSQWDTIRDVHEFIAAFFVYGDARFGDRKAWDTFKATWEGEHGYALIERVSNQSLWILAPDVEIVEIIREELPFPAKPW